MKKLEYIDVTPEPVVGSKTKRSIKKRLKKWALKQAVRGGLSVATVLLVANAVDRQGYYPVWSTLGAYSKRQAVQLALQIPHWPFTELHEKNEHIAFLRQHAQELEEQVGIEATPTRDIIEQELREVELSDDLYYAFLGQENPKFDPLAYNINVNKKTLKTSIDCGIGQISQSNWDRCGLTVKTCFNRRKNIRCSVMIAKENYVLAKKLVKSKERPQSCTGAQTVADHIVEYAARAYNGGPKFASSNVDAQEKTCKHAAKVRANYNRILDKHIAAQGMELATIEHDYKPEAPVVVQVSNNNFWNEIF